MKIPNFHSFPKCSMTASERKIKMFFVHPANEDISLRIIKENDLAADSIILTADDEGETVGFVAFSIEKSLLTICHLNANGEDAAEMLLRAAFNYGERRAVYEVESLVKEPENVFKTLGFCEKDQKFVSNITNVVHVCKNCTK